MQYEKNSTPDTDGEDEGCPLDMDTCVMDTTKKLDDEKNKELMKHGLDSLDDLL